MGQAMPPAERPTYEQLEEIIRRKDAAVSRAYWMTEGFRSVVWMAAMAHDSGMPGYSEENYAGAASHVFHFLATVMREHDESFSMAHHGIKAAVLAGQPESGEVADA